MLWLLEDRFWLREAHTRIWCWGAQHNYVLREVDIHSSEYIYIRDTAVSWSSSCKEEYAVQTWRHEAEWNFILWKIKLHDIYNSRWLNNVAIRWWWKAISGEIQEVTVLSCIRKALIYVLVHSGQIVPSQLQSEIMLDLLSHKVFCRNSFYSNGLDSDNLRMENVIILLYRLMKILSYRNIWVGWVLFLVSKEPVFLIIACKIV